MPANATGEFWSCLARETGRIGHMYSLSWDKKRSQFVSTRRSPRPWLPFLMDCGMFLCWDRRYNTIDWDKWARMEPVWWQSLLWAQTMVQQPLAVIVPDAPGNREKTLERWAEFAPQMKAMGFPLMVALQNGMTEEDVRALRPLPDAFGVGGDDLWKWDSAPMWRRAFPEMYAHLLRCNSPAKLDRLAEWGYDSCDGTGWTRGDLAQTQGLEEFCRRNADPYIGPLWPSVCKGKVKGSAQGELW